MGGARLRARGRGIAVVLAAVTLSAGFSLLVLPSAASAQGIPNKSCVDPATSDGTAKAGDTIVCTVSIGGIIANGSSFSVQPTAPTGAYIPADGCHGASGGSTPFTYTTTATDNGKLGTPAGQCIFTVSSGAIGIGNNVIGTEKLFIPATTAANTSVTQNATECLAPSQCGPTTPMGVSGPGSCVGGSAVPVLGGCQPPAPGSPSPSASSSPTPTTAASTTPTPTAQVVASTTPFTGGPPHPFPVAATAVAAAGAALALAGLFAPALIRRRRSDRTG